MGALKWGLKATLGNLRTIVYNCALLWPFWAPFSGAIRRKMMTIVGNRGQLWTSLLSPHLLSPHLDFHHNVLCGLSQCYTVVKRPCKGRLARQDQGSSNSRRLSIEARSMFKLSILLSGTQWMQMGGIAADIPQSEVAATNFDVSGESLDEKSGENSWRVFLLHALRRLTHKMSPKIH